MLPGLTIQDPRCVRGADSEARSDFLRTLSASPDIRDLSIGQLGVAVLLARGTASPCAHVEVVVVGRSKFQMIWPNTWRIVAAVPHERSSRDFPEMKLPRDSMRSPHANSRRDASVTAPVVRCRRARALPFPTAFALPHLQPESLRERSPAVNRRPSCSMGRVHLSESLRGRLPRPIHQTSITMTPRSHPGLDEACADRAARDTEIPRQRELRLAGEVIGDEPSGVDRNSLHGYDSPCRRELFN